MEKGFFQWIYDKVDIWGIIQGADSKYKHGDFEGAIADYTRAIELEPNDPVLFHNRGYAKKAKGDFEGAIADCTRAIELKPDYADAFYTRGNAKYQKRDFEGTISDCTRAIELKPDYSDAFYIRGTAKYQKRDFEGTISDCTRAIELKPDYSDAFYIRGNAKYQKGDYEGAIADCTRAIELKPDYADAFYTRGNAKYQKRDFEGTISDCTRAIELKPDYADAFYSRGNAKFAKGDFEGAIADYTRAIELEPNDPLLFHNRGNARFAKRDFEGAISDSTRAIELNPDYADAFHSSGIAKLSKGDFEGAIADSIRAIELNPDYADAFHSSGIAKLSKGDFEGAIADSTRAIELKPDYADAFHIRGTAKFAKGDFEGAIADYTRAIELNPDYADAFHSSGIAKLSKEDFEGAIADSTRAIELKPNYASAFHIRGTAKLSKEDYDGAIADFTRAIELNPNYASAFNYRGNAKFAKRDYEGAIADYTRAIELKPNYANAFHNRGYAKYHKGNYKGAIADFSRAIELDPKMYKSEELERLNDLITSKALSIEDLTDTIRDIHTNDASFKTVTGDLKPEKFEKLSLTDLQDRLKLLMEYYWSFADGNEKDKQFKEAYNNLLDTAVARGGKDALVFSKLDDGDIDNTLLHLAVRYCNVNDTKLLEKIIKINPELINYQNPEYRNHTPLHVVTQDTINPSIAKFLLNNGANPDMKSEGGGLFEVWFESGNPQEYNDLMATYYKIIAEYFIKAAVDNNPDLIENAINSLKLRSKTISDLSVEAKETIKEAFLLAHDVGSREAADKILDVIKKQIILDVIKKERILDVTKQQSEFSVLMYIDDGICEYNNKLYSSAKEFLTDAISEETSEKIKKQIGKILGKVQMEHAMSIYNSKKGHYIKKAFKLMTSALDNNSGLLGEYKDKISEMYLDFGNNMALSSTEKIDALFYYVNAHQTNPVNNYTNNMIPVHGQFHSELASILSNEILASKCLGSNRVPYSTPNKISKFFNLPANAGSSGFLVPLKLVLTAEETLEGMQFSRVGNHFMNSGEIDNFITKVSAMVSQDYMQKINEINSSNSSTKVQEVKGLASYVATHIIKYLSTDAFEKSGDGLNKNGDGQGLINATVQHVLAQPEMDRHFYTKMSEVISKRMSKMMSKAEDVSLETPEGEKRIVRDQLYSRASSGGSSGASSSMVMHM